MSEETKSESQTKSSKKQVSRLWITGTDGKASISATFATVAFFATTAAYLASIVEGYGELKFRAFDVAACGAYMVPILSLYFGRRWTEKSSKKDD